MHQVVGILGDGQLSMMLVQACHQLAIQVKVMGNTQNPSVLSALPLSSYYKGDYNDLNQLIDFSSGCDVITIENEYINTQLLKHLEDIGKCVLPTSQALDKIQNKFKQKLLLRKLKIPTTAFADVVDKASLTNFIEQNEYPVIIKLKLMSYDGYGNTTIKNQTELDHFIKNNLTRLNSYYVESFVSYKKEVAVMAVKAIDETKFYPLVETLQHQDRCEIVVAPAFNLEKQVLENTKTICSKLVDELGSTGTFGIEMFITKDDLVLVNEIAPRVHNSGHYTIEGCNTSQFENHIRAICGLKLGSTETTSYCVSMVNVLGDNLEETYFKEKFTQISNIDKTNLHYYYKTPNKLGRKMGHVTILEDTYCKLSNKTWLVLENNYQNQIPQQLKSKAQNLLNRTPLFQVSVVMGSDSDLRVMKDACQILEEFNINYETLIISAHRTPEKLFKFCQNAYNRQTRVIIAGAGGAAHLPGMIASMTSIPVIGVPVSCTQLNGVDSLYSIVQMPKGIPVATVAIDNATNAGLLAVRILGIKDHNTIEAMDKYRLSMSELVTEKAELLEDIGWKNYILDKQNKELNTKKYSFAEQYF